MRSGGLPGLQNRVRGDDVTLGGFDSHTLPPTLRLCSTPTNRPVSVTIRVSKQTRYVSQAGRSGAVNLTPGLSLAVILLR